MTAALTTVDYLKQCGVKDQNPLLISDTSEQNTPLGLFRSFGDQLKQHINSKIDYERVFVKYKRKCVHHFVGTGDVICDFVQIWDYSVDIVILFYWNHRLLDSLGMPDVEIMLHNFGTFSENVSSIKKKASVFL
jgi:hypothetical protein